jgi:GTP-binding protein
VAGRPNVGKSTLINTWLGEERLVAFDLPGTTRDAIHVPFERGGRRYELIDTAGLRRKGKVFEAIEKFSVVKTLQAIADANVVLLLIDATQGVGDQDAHIAGYILESGRAVVVAVNKWDAVDDYQRQMLERSMESRLGFLKFAQVLHISALKRRGIGAVWKAIDEAHASATRKLSTPQLTRLIQDAVQHQAPKRVGHFRPKLRYAHQGGMNPPVVVVHGNSLEHMTDSYQPLPGGPHPRPVQARRHAAAGGDEAQHESLRRQGFLRSIAALPQWPSGPVITCSIDINTEKQP